MTTAEKISIALPPEMVHIVRGAVATGEYAQAARSFVMRYVTGHTSATYASKALPNCVKSGRKQ
jgi:hypothetical protein